ncbi:MAG: hypothetical protein U0166_12830 [Acidobacteriota bacterium]
MGPVEWLRYGGLLVASVAGLIFIFGKYFLGADMTDKWATFTTVWVVCGISWGLATMLKFTGRVGMKVSRKKCIKCPKLAAMGSIYCDFHQKQASREVAFQSGTEARRMDDEDDSKLGY